MREKLMTISELADLLSTSKSTIYQSVYHRRIPCVKINKKTLRFDPAAIRDWLKSKTRDAVEKEPKQPVRRSPGRPKKNGRADEKIERLIESVKAEVLG
jgi:excisionase family DNA binding protein